MLGVLVAAGYLLWQEREAPAPAVTDEPSRERDEAPSLVGMKTGASKKDAPKDPEAGAEVPDKAGPPTSLIVRVTLRGKPAPAGVRVRMRPEKRASGRTLTVKTNAAGEAAFGEVLPGSLVFETYWSGYALTSTYWEAEEGAKHKIGAFAFEATREYEIALVLPAK